MPVAYDNSAQAEGLAVSTIVTASWAIAGSDRALVAGVGWDDGLARTVSAVRWGGSGGTDLSRKAGATIAFGGADAWQLVAPTAASQTLYVLMSGAVDSLYLAGVSFTGVDQTTMSGTAATGSANNAADIATATATATSAANATVVDIVYSYANSGANATLAVGAGQTQRQADGTINTYAVGGMSTEAGAASVTMSWTMDSAVGATHDWALVAVPLTEATAGATIYNRLIFTSSIFSSRVIRR